MPRIQDLEYSRRYSRKYPERRILSSLRAKAKRLNIPFDLTPEDIQLPDVCPVLGLPLVRNIGHRRAAPNSASVDRINPELGYVRGNIQVISKRANLMKNDATFDELRKFANWVNQTLGEV